MRIIFLAFIFVHPLLINNEEIISYNDIIKNHCTPPFHYYKSWCYYIFPNLALDWSSAYRLCRSIDKNTYLVYISSDDEMTDPLRDILINREKSQGIKSIWTNTTWGQLRRTILSRQSKRLCRKIDLKSNMKFGDIDTLRMPFTNCREKHTVMCRKELPSNIVCRRPWALAYGICYYLDEQKHITKTEEEERNVLQCQAWNGQLFSSSKQEKNILMPFLSYSLHGLRSSRILSENFGGIAYTFQNIIQDNCSLVSGDTYLSAIFNQLKNQSLTKNCSLYNSYTLCRQIQNTTCQPPWFYDDGFCLYFSSHAIFDMSAATSECSKQGGYLLYVNNEEELFRLTHNLAPLTPFFKHLSLAGVWLALSYRTISSFSNDLKDDGFGWRWDLSIEPYLDDQWKLYGWRKFFQHRLSPYIVSAGDCAALILDTKIREPIERTSCNNQRTVVCRKPLNNETKSFHKKSQYDKILNLKNSTKIIEFSSKLKNVSSTTLTIIRNVFEPFNSTAYRLIIYFNGSSTLTTNLIFTCKSKGIIFSKSIESNHLLSIMKFDMKINSIDSEYKILFNHFQSFNCTNTTTVQCIYSSCIENDHWYYTLPDIQSRLNMFRNQSTNNYRCLMKHNNSNIHVQICSVLIDQFGIYEDSLLPKTISSINTNDCKDFGGQCIPNSLILSTSMQFSDSTLICPTGYICWLQGELCSNDSYCIDRVRFPCSSESHLTNVTCSNSHHDCCTSLSVSLDSSLIISTTSNQQNWNILLPIYYFSFHGTSKWDKFFFNSWLHMGSDISHDFVNDEFLFSCIAIFIEPTLLLTHDSCLPTRLTSYDKRSILFSLVKKNDDDDEYDRVALHIDTYQISSPFQLVRLAYRHDFLVNKTYKRLNDKKLNKEKINELYCVLVLSENNIKQIKLMNDFERQFIFYDNISLFSYVNLDENEDEDEQWSFSPILCILNEKSKDWMIVGISGRQLKHQCQIVNYVKYCQMTFVYTSTWFDY